MCRDDEQILQNLAKKKINLHVSKKNSTFAADLDECFKMTASNRIELRITLSLVITMFA